MATWRCHFPALVLCLCIWGVSITAEHVPDPAEGDSLVELPVEDEPAEAKADKPKAQRRLITKVKAVNELDRQVQDLKKKRTEEKDTKAQKTVRYMETYSARKAYMASTKARLEKRLEEDKAGVLATTPSLAAAHEKNVKHDANIKKAMKKALHAMKTVHELARNKDPADPTIKDATKAVNTAQGSSVYTVLGLDAKQLGKEYLLNLDAAVAAFDAKPTASAHEKLQKATKATQESMKKDEMKEANKKKEKTSKKTRAERNKKYYKVKWEEKKKELAEKKKRKNKLVKKMAATKKLQMKLRVKSADEKQSKGLKTSEEVKQKVAAQNKFIKQDDDRKKAESNNKKTTQEKTSAEGTRLLDKAKKATSNYKAKEEETKKANLAKDTASKELVAASSGDAFAQKEVPVAKAKLKAATALASKMASAANIRLKADAQNFLTAKETKALKTKQKVTQAKATLKEKEEKVAKAKLDASTAKTAASAAEKKAALFKKRKEAAKPIKKVPAAKVPKKPQF